MATTYDPSALWVALSEQNDKDIFTIYPKLLAKILLEEEAARLDGDTSEAEKLVLPSDKDWRLEQYFYMVSLQKDLDAETTEDGDAPQAPVRDDSVEEWAPWNITVSTKNPRAPPPVDVKTSPGPVWDIEQVLKAAKLLCRPPLAVEFSDEQEMRCVYSVIYEVFRYKTVLDQAIEDVDFFCDFPQHKQHCHAVWLFVMELAKRKWGARPRGEIEKATKLLQEAGTPFVEIEKDIWDQRVHFAAAIARIRIKNKAFALADLLPIHLREERITACVHKETVTGWVNTFKAKKIALLVKRLHQLGYSYSNSRQLCAGEYRFDRVCPRFITLRPPANVKIAQWDIIRDGIIVLQEREFCEGASTLCRALRANSLKGVVAQTHASSPRCSAYLAAQLRELAAVLKNSEPSAPATPQLGRLVVFGAGDKVESYVASLKELGIDASVTLHAESPVCVLSESVYCDTPTVANALDGVVAVLATPPNSYSAVTDPIDLVCGRGGDLAMLEILTESEIDSSGKERVQSILEEQKKTLRTLMSKPQIQLILYETHSALEAENEAQVSRAISEANRLARERHFLLKKKNRGSPQKHVSLEQTALESTTTLNSTMHSEFDDTLKKEDQDVVHNPSPTRTLASSPRSQKSRPQTADTTSCLKKRNDSADVNSRSTTYKTRPIPGISDVPKDPDKDNPNIYVPDSDLFEVGDLPGLGCGLDIKYILDRDGCYLGLIQRKEITRLDAKFMIRVAEDRGLFGPGAAAAPPARRKRPEQTHSSDNHRRKRKNSFEVERVAAPTYASLSRSCRHGSAPARVSDCPKHLRRQAAALSAIICTCNDKHNFGPPTIHEAKRFDVEHKRPAKRSPRTSIIGNAVEVRLTDVNKIEIRPSYRRASLDTSTPRSPGHPNCRRPFPVVVHDLRLPAVQTCTTN